MGSTVQRGLLIVVIASCMILALWILLPDREPPATYEVVAVTSGDTLEVEPTNADPAPNAGAPPRITVRLLGVRAPAEGECGFEESRAYLAEGVDGVIVTVLPGDDPATHGNTIVRYVEVQGLDVGLAQIAESHAVADGTDHDRVELYEEADAATPNPCDAEAAG